MRPRVLWPRPRPSEARDGGRARARPLNYQSPCFWTSRSARFEPALYSQFAEHIGGVIYDGIWVGPESKVANIDGIRQALVEHVRQLGPVVVRWPGGCFADKYHWRDGIGPRSKRPRRFGRWREETESNQFGTHEFIRFCRLCGVEPYLAANVGTGSPEEFQQWVEYCNAPAGSTTLADERAANGEREAVRRPLLGRRQRELGLRRQVHPRGLLPRVPPVYRLAAPVRRAAVPDRRRPQRQRPRLDPTVLRQVGSTASEHRSRAGRRTITAARPATPSNSLATSGTRSSTRPTRWSR